MPFHTIEGVVFCEVCGRKAREYLGLNKAPGSGDPYCPHCEHEAAVAPDDFKEESTDKIWWKYDGPYDAFVVADCTHIARWRRNGKVDAREIRSSDEGYLRISNTVINETCVPAHVRNQLEYELQKVKNEKNTDNTDSAE